MNTTDALELFVIVHKKAHPEDDTSELEKDIKMLKILEDC